MKVLKNLTVIAAGAIMFASCCESGDKCPIKDMSTASYDSVSYAVGVSFGNMLKNANIAALNYSELNRGIKEVISGKEVTLSDARVGELINGYVSKLMEIKKQEATAAQAAFMSENAKKDGIQVTESGIQYKLINEGGVHPTAADTVEVKYVGRLLDGTEFDSSSEPIKFPLNRVVSGWTEGMQLVGEGGKIELWIPFELGYGDRAMSPKLPAFSTLNFEVELIKVYPEAKK